MASKAYNAKFVEDAKKHPLIPPQVIKELHQGARNAAISDGLKMREKPAEGDVGHEEAETPDEEAMEQPESPDELDESPEGEAKGTDESDLEEAFEKDCGFSYPEKNEKWIQKAINPAHKGALREKLGVSEGKNIPSKKLSAAIKKGKKESATESEKTTMRQALLAKRLKKMH